MNRKPSFLFEQSGVIPYRRRDGVVEVLLITSSDGLRWGIPKGVIEPDLSSAESAAKEAYEEAGIRGRLHPDSVGTYSYQKWGGTCRVEVFLLEVTEELKEWPERLNRQREWVALDEATRRVMQNGLKELLLKGAQCLDRVA